MFAPLFLVLTGDRPVSTFSISFANDRHFLSNFANKQRKTCTHRKLSLSLHPDVLTRRPFLRSDAQ